MGIPFELLLHSQDTALPWAYLKICSCNFKIPFILNIPLETAPAFPGYRPSMGIKKPTRGGLFIYQRCDL